MRSGGSKLWGALLGAVLVVGCGAAQSPPIAPSPPVDAHDPQGRARACLATLNAHPTDHRAHACYREAMARQDRAAEAVKEVTRVTEGRDPALATYFVARALSRIDVEASTDSFATCRAAHPTSAWCHYGAARLLADRGETRAALAALDDARATEDAAELAALAGLLHLRAEVYDAAAEEGARALVLDEAHPDGQLLAARIALLSGELDAAERHLARARRGAPDASTPLQLEGQLRQARGDVHGARVALRSALAIDARDDEARWALAQLLLEEDEAADALEHLNLLVDAHPERLDYGLALSEALLETGAPGRALGWADLVLARAPDDGRALALRARALIRTGRVDEALALRERLYAHPTHAPERRVALAIELARAGRAGQAESEFAEAVARHPDQPGTWRAIADWYARRRLLGRATTLLERGLEAVPDSAGLRADLSVVLEKRGDLPAALEKMAEAAELDPAEPAYADERARLEFMTGEHTGAVARWEDLVERAPHFDRALMNLSHAYRALGRMSDAVSALQRLLARHPDDPELLLRVGETLLRARSHNRSIDYLRRALRVGADANRVRPLLAAALADVGHIEEADAMFAAALGDDPANRDLRLTYARFKEQLRDVDGALELYRQQLARDPRDPQALERVEGLLGDDDEARAFALEARARPGLDADLGGLLAQVEAPGAEQLGTILRDERYVTVDARGVARVRHVRTVLVQRVAGVDRYETASVSFHAHHAPEVVTARTITPDGEVLPVPPGARAVRNPHAGTPLHGDARNLELKFTRVEPGAILDYEVVTFRPHPELPDVWWDGYILGNVDPTLRVRYELALPVDEKFVFEAPGLSEPSVREDGETRVLTWGRTGLGPYQLSAADGPELPAVYVSNMRDWAHVDEWYDGLFSPQTEVTPALADATRALVADADDVSARVAAIYGFVEREVGYLGIEFGIGAYQPRPATRTLTQKQGDCKDMTALMVAMLREIGVASFPALVRPRSQGVFIPKHPSPGQFSHVLLYVPRKDGPDLWLDATAGLGTLDAVPDVLRGRHAFVVDGKGGRLVEIPQAETKAHRFEETLRYMLTMTGGGELLAEMRLSGDVAGGARRRLLEVDDRGRQALLASPGYLLGRGRTPTAVEVKRLHDAAAPLELRARMADPDLVGLRADGTLLLPFDMVFFTDGPLPALGEGAHVSGPRTFVRTARIEPPPGYVFDWTPVRYRRADHGVMLTVEERRGEAYSEIVTRLRLDRPQRSAADHQALLRVLRHARVALDRPLQLRPGARFDAVAFYRALVSERQDDARLRMLLGKALLETDRTREALEVLEGAEELEGADHRVQALIAAAALRLDDSARAEAPLRVLLGREDASPQLFMTLAAVLVEQSRADDAVPVLRDGLARHPGDPTLARRLVQALALTGEKAAAVKAAAELADAHPEDAPTQALYGTVAADAGQRELAERAYRAALAVDAAQPTVLNNLAWLLRDEPERLEEAIAMVERAVEIEPGRDAAWDTLAELQLRNGSPRAALRAIDEALRLNPARAAMYQLRRARILEALEPL